jgi:hypothetical protein
MVRILVFSALLSIGITSFGQNCPEIDTVYLVQKAKKSIIKTNQDLYKTPPVLKINWDHAEIFCGNSVDCDHKAFVFFLIGFVDSAGHYATVIFEHKSKRKFLLLEVMFSIDSPKQIFDGIVEDPHYDWGCDI